MFKNFTELTICLYKHNSLVSVELLDIIIEHLSGRNFSREILEKFVTQLALDSTIPENKGFGLTSEKYRPEFVGAEGLVYLGKNKKFITKVFIHENKSYNLFFDNYNKIIISFLNTVTNYLLIKSILKEAFELGYTNSDLSVYFHDIVSIHCLKNPEKPEKFQLQMISQYLNSQWEKIPDKKTMNVARDIYTLLIELDKLAVNHGITITHGDLKMDNIVLTQNLDTKIIDLGLSTVRVDFGGNGINKKFNYLISSLEKYIKHRRFNDLVFFSFDCFWLFKCKYSLRVDEKLAMEFVEGIFDSSLCEVYKGLLKSKTYTNDVRYEFINGILLKYFENKQDTVFYELAEDLHLKFI